MPISKVLAIRNTWRSHSEGEPSVPLYGQMLLDIEVIILVVREGEQEQERGQDREDSWLPCGLRLLRSATNSPAYPIAGLA